GKYDANTTKLQSLGTCPGCLDGAGQASLRDSVTSQVDAASGLLFVCPTTTTSTSITTSTSTSITTSTSTSSTTTTSTSTSSSSTTTPSTTIAGFTKLRLSLTAGTTSCGDAGLYQHCLSGNNLGGTNGLGACTLATDCGTSGTPNCSTPRTGASPPFAGQLNNAAATKLVDLGAGCLYFGGGNGINVP